MDQLGLFFRVIACLGLIFSNYQVAIAQRQDLICGQSYVNLPLSNASYPARTGDFPWLVRFDIAGNPMCTGAIITNQWIISSANCFFANDSQVVFSGDVLAHLGDINLSMNDVGEQVAEIDKIVIHPMYDEIKLEYNFALLHVNTPLMFSDLASPICMLDECSDENDPNSICVIGGWGSDHALFDAGDAVDHLRKTAVPLVDRQVCKDTLAAAPDTGDIVVGDDMTCAGYESGHVDDCQGDTGGPLICRSNFQNAYYLQGINSLGYGCNEPEGYYHIYARPCAVMPWIRSVTEPTQPEIIQALQPLVPAVQPNPKKVTRLVLTSDSDNQLCGQNKYGMMAAGFVPVPRQALILEYPWQVRLELGHYDSIDTYTCGGTLVSNSWVMTSARCIGDATRQNKTTIIAHFGEYDLRRPTSNEQSMPVVDTFLHPLYDASNYDNDYALLRLKDAVPFSDATRPICLLADCDTRPEDDQPVDCLTVGWQTIANRKSDPAKTPLVVAGVNISSISECRKQLGEVEYTDRKVCVSSLAADGRPPCQVDAGGPLICKMTTDNAYFLHGVASYAQKGCTKKDSFLIYSRPCFVGRWIQDTVHNYAQNANNNKVPAGADALARNINANKNV